MAAPQCVPALASYLDALPSRYDVREHEDGCLLTTPFYLPDNSRLGVHLVGRPDGTLEVTDFGTTLDNLFASGVTVPDNDRRLVTIGRRFGVRVEGGEIRLTTTPEDLGEAITAVVHAILDAAYLVYTRRSRAAPNFGAEIEQVLIGDGRRYDTRFEVTGATDRHTFDYHLAGARAPLLIEALSTTSRQMSLAQARITSFKVIDTRRATEDNGYRFACLIDDRTPEQQDAITERTLNTLSGNVDTVVLWSEREKVTALLAS